MRIEVDHTTLYRYSGKVSRSTTTLRLQPATGRGQRVLDWRLDLPARAAGFTDSFGNLTQLLTLDAPYDALTIRARGVVDVDVESGPEDTEPVIPVVFLLIDDISQFIARLFRRQPDRLADGTPAP